MNTAVSFEYRSALRDTQATEREYGADAVVSLRREGEVTRDAYDSIVGRTAPFTTISTKVATIEYQPTRKQVEKANLRETCDALVYVSMLDLIDRGLTFSDLDIKRMTVTVGAVDLEALGKRYEVIEKSRAGQMGNGYLYLTLGLKSG